MTTTSRSAAPRASAEGAITYRSAVSSTTALLGFFLLVSLVGGIGAVTAADAVQGWYVETPKPMWTPPTSVFGPVWSVLYATMAVGAWLVWRSEDSPARDRALRVFALQLTLNAIWTPVFFGLGSMLGTPGLWLALGVIVALAFAILATIIRFGEVSRAAAALLLPYWFWVLFATTLNAAIAVLAP